MAISGEFLGHIRGDIMAISGEFLGHIWGDIMAASGEFFMAIDTNIIDSLSAVNTIPTPLSIVMDRGIATKENLELLKKRGYPYIVIERSDKRSTYTEQFLNAKEGFTKMEKKGSEAVYVKAIPCEEGTRVLCLSEGRAAKEHSMDEARRARFFSGSFQIERTHRGGQAQK